LINCGGLINCGCLISRAGAGSAGVQLHLERNCEAGDGLSFLIQHSRMRESAQVTSVR
jgi:hypothetical protein